jgi:hypothetical protein
MLHSQKDIEKCVISAADGDIGQVKDIYFDDHAGRPATLSSTREVGWQNAKC